LEESAYWVDGDAQTISMTNDFYFGLATRSTLPSGHSADASDCDDTEQDTFSF
jgi:hypothetical protein